MSFSDNCEICGNESIEFLKYTSHPLCKKCNLNYDIIFESIVILEKCENPDIKVTYIIDRYWHEGLCDDASETSDCFRRFEMKTFEVEYPPYVKDLVEQAIPEPEKEEEFPLPSLFATFNPGMMEETLLSISEEEIEYPRKGLALNPIFRMFYEVESECCFYSRAKYNVIDVTPILKNG